jgi:hypothetical protein
MKAVGVASFLALALVAAGAVLAQPMRAPRAGACRGRTFDPGRIETISGRITDITSMGRRARGMHAWLDTSSGRVEIALGPSDYLQSQSLHLATGDQVEVSGWRVQMPRGEMFVPSVIHRGKEALQLRDENGIPAWVSQYAGGFGGPDDPCPCGGCAYVH